MTEDKYNQDRESLLAELYRHGITEPKVLAALEATPREVFVPPYIVERAYENTALPIGHEQTISQPYIVGLMTQSLEVGDRMKVLEIGTGSGYQAAILARLCRRVYTIERRRALLREAERRFALLRLSNIVTLAGDGTKGWPDQAPFHRIMITAAAPDIPEILLDQLAPGGILVTPVGGVRGDQKLLRLRRTVSGFDSEELCAVRFVPLVAGKIAE